MSSSTVGQKREARDDAEEVTAAKKLKISAEPFSLSPSKLRFYYNKSFPTLHFSGLLDGGRDLDASTFFLREIGYVVIKKINNEEKEIYTRYKAFYDHIEFAKDLYATAPVSVHIGPKYNISPLMRETQKLIVLERELIFDLDLNDYDSVRYCHCVGTPSYCSQCWVLMKAAVKILDTVLRQCFDFESILWVYSGRRGVHCWVCDEKARKMSTHARSALVHHIKMLGSSDFLPSVLHPYTKKIFDDIALNCFLEYLDNFDISDSTGYTKFMVQFCENFETSEKLRLKIVSFLNEELYTLKDAFEFGKTHLRVDCQPKGDYERTYGNKEKQFVFRHVYPRLDATVTQDLTHLLKAPFSVHPKTGKICVPFEASKIDSFDPNKVPTVNDLSFDVRASGKEADVFFCDSLDLFKEFTRKLNNK